MSEDSSTAITPDRIMQTAMGFWPAKILMSAIKLGLFTELSGAPRTAGEIQHKLGLHERSLYDFLDALVALGFLERDGFGQDAHYRNAPDTEQFLVEGQPAYIGRFAEMANDRLYPFWGDLEEALQTGRPQNETKHGDRPLFETLYEDPERLKQFTAAMAGIQIGAFMALAETFDFAPYRSLLDVGGASGALSIQVARHNDHIHGITTDLPAVEPVAQRNIRDAGLEDRIEARSLDFQKEDFPAVDVITMGNILHDWPLDEKKMLIEKAYRALNPGGAFIAIENLIDNEQRENVFGLMMSLNMLIETDGGFDFTGADFERWATDAGFHRTETRHLAGPTSAAIAYK